MATIQERYSPQFVSTNTTVKINSASIGGFLAKTDGAITVVNASGVTVVSAHPVTAGVYYPLPMLVGFGGATFATDATASGTLLV